MKRKLLLVLLFSCFILTGCKTFEIGDISSVKTDINNLNEHDKREIEKAFNIIKYEFQTDTFKDCQLLTIDYYGDNVDRERELLISHQGAKEAIILILTFKTGKHPSQVFNSNTKYEYTAELIKDENGNWRMVNWGQG